MKQFVIFVLALVIVVGTASKTVQAQSNDGTPTPEPLPQDQEDADIPLVHVVEEGETLFSIAVQYETTIETLQLLNNISDPSLLFVGQELIIPGGGGQMVATVHTIQVGDTLPGVAAGYNTTVEAIAQNNHLVNPDYLVAGYPLTVLSRTGSAEPQPLSGDVYYVQAGDTLMTIAARHNLAPAAILAINGLHTPAYLYEGQRLRLPGETDFQFLTGPWKQVRSHPSPITQGGTVAIYVESQFPDQPEGSFAGQALHFAPYENGFVALAGVDAFTEPGRYLLELDGPEEESWPSFEQDVLIDSSGYGTVLVTIPEEISYLLEPQIRADEDAFLATIYTQFSQTPSWEGLFQVPITNTTVTSRYGDARSYNEGPIEIYHSGVDFLGPVGTPIYAPAAGTVVFSQTLELRGITLIIDHGLGVMTGYYHLSEILVELGEVVEAGDLIARGGSTGLSSGPHLHWDLRVMNVTVDGLQWTSEPFP